MNHYMTSKLFLLASLVFCTFLLCSSTPVTATKLDISMSLSIPYFLRVFYSNGSYSETITTQDQSILRRISLEFMPRNDGLYESVITLDIRSNANWQLTITPINIDDSSYWTIHESANDPQHLAIEACTPISELGATFQCNPETPFSWHLHVLSPCPVEKELVPAKEVVGAQPSSAASMPSIQLSVVQHGS